MKNIYEYDIHKNEIINDSKLLPTDNEIKIMIDYEQIIINIKI